MPTASRYQAVIIDPASTGSGQILRQTFLRRCEELGLVGDEVVVLDEENYNSRNLIAPLAAVYFGSGDAQKALPKVEPTIEKLVADGTPILPLVTDLKECKHQLPQCLRRINAQQTDPQDLTHEYAAGWLLEELSLLRKQRLVFISYRRDEALRVALQLYHRLDERSFRVFLDTHSIRPGSSFQELLHDRLADADILMFLDTPTALDSKWVEEEFSFAHNLGLGVLHVVWPDHQPRKEAGLNSKFILKREDFASGLENLKEAQLTDDALSRLVSSAEALRARTLAARRIRVVETFQRRAIDKGMVAVLTPERYIQVERPVGSSARMYPVVGHPNTLLMEKVHTECPATEPASLIYDDCGMIKATMQHLNWLNSHVPVKAVALTEVDSWLDKLAR